MVHTVVARKRRGMINISVIASHLSFVIISMVVVSAAFIATYYYSMYLVFLSFLLLPVSL